MRKQMFNTKEEYLAFRKSWKDFINQKKHLKKKAYYSNWHKEQGLFYWSSDLTSTHHIIFNALMGRELDIGFDKAHEDGKFFEILRSTKLFLTYLAKDNVYSKESREKFSEPFGSALTPEMIDKIKAELEEPMLVE